MIIKKMTATFGKLEGAVLEGNGKVLMACPPDRENLRAELGYRAENVAGLMD